MSLTLFVGPMFSGKSSSLLLNMKKYTIINKGIITINHSFDKRYSREGEIITHDGKKIKDSNIQFFSMNSFSQFKEDDILNEYSAVFIDEGQFFPDIIEMIDYFVEKNKNVYVSFLNADYKMEPFNNVNHIYSKADKIMHLTAVCCSCGDDAPFTKRLIKSEEQVLIGSDNMYQPRCRKCFYKNE